MSCACSKSGRTIVLGVNLFCLDRPKALEEKLPNLRFVPAILSGPGEDGGWRGETGLITDVVKCMEGDLSGTAAYPVGPPPMIDAAIQVLEMKGVDLEHVYFDKFTTMGAQEGSEEKDMRGPEAGRVNSTSPTSSHRTPL